MSISHISSATIYSSYGNLNEITRYKYYKNIILQDKIKQFLLDECFPKIKILISNDTQSPQNYLPILKTNNSLINSKLVTKTIRKQSRSIDLKSTNKIKKN